MSKILQRFQAVSLFNRSCYRWVSSFSQSNTDNTADITIIGGGIIGLASACEIQRRKPSLKISVVEKESKLSQHQSGSNSGVIHAGIYYKPGSLRAKLCVEGSALMYDYCDKYSVPYKKVGKLIVATNNIEVERLHNLYERALLNKCKEISLIDAKEIKNIEPNCVGIKAIYSPHTGITDFKLVVESFAENFRNYGGHIFTRFEACKFSYLPNSASSPVHIYSKDGRSIKSKFVLTCGGLHSDRLAALTKCDKNPVIMPFRGEYLKLKSSKSSLVNGNIYPVPDPQLPFLGVHFTPRMNGDVWLGPNAVLAFAREGYTKTTVNTFDLLESITSPSLWKLGFRHFTYGIKELYKSYVMSAQLKAAQKFLPCLRLEDIERGPAGVRAQAMDAGGNLVDDFIFDSGTGEMGTRVLHVRNAPSPGATSSLAIAQMVYDKVELMLTNLQIK